MKRLNQAADMLDDPEVTDAVNTAEEHLKNMPQELGAALREGSLEDEKQALPHTLADFWLSAAAEAAAKYDTSSSREVTREIKTIRSHLHDTAVFDGIFGQLGSS